MRGSRQHELDIVRTVIGSWGLLYEHIDLGHDPPDVVVSSGQQVLEFEVTDARPFRALQAAGATDSFHDLLERVSTSLPPVKATHLLHHFGGTTIAVQFQRLPPRKRPERAAHRILEWLLRHSNLRGKHEFANDASADFYLANPATAGWAPPEPGLTVIFVHETGPKSSRPTFGLLRKFHMWDPHVALVEVIRRKLAHPYSSGSPLHLAVGVPDVPSKWSVDRLREDLAEDLVSCQFTSIWFADRREAMKFL